MADTTSTATRLCNVTKKLAIKNRATVRFKITVGTRWFASRGMMTNSSRSATTSHTVRLGSRVCSCQCLKRSVMIEKDIYVSKL